MTEPRMILIFSELTELVEVGGMLSILNPVKVLLTA